jgi:hypothetical protein
LALNLGVQGQELRFFIPDGRPLPSSAEAALARAERLAQHPRSAGLEPDSEA